MASTIYNFIEKFFDTLGMMSGNFAEMKRFAFGALVTGGVLYVIQPSIMFGEKGNMRQFALMPGNEGVEGTTYLPLWAAVLIGGTIPAMFV